MLGECMSVHDCNCDHGLNIQQIDMNCMIDHVHCGLFWNASLPSPPPAYHFRRALPLTIEILKFRASS